MLKDDKEIVSAIRSKLAEQLGNERFELWFGDQVQWKLVDQRLHLQVPDHFSAERLRRSFHK
ncbi:MAG: DnaA N-terminal domain-containing protein, partial [Pirellulaceae bacterium]